MSVKTDVLRALEKNIGKSISGEQLASELSISRAAVWKAINLLKKDGYCISASTNKGYSLNIDTDVLSFEGILPYLDEQNNHIKIIVHKSIGSTNSEAKRLACDGADHATTVVAAEQTEGKGRLGREFFSPANSGIYMSMVLKLEVQISDAILITTAASVAVCRAIEQISPQLLPQIKWVNDIYVDDKKVCGILTEAVTSFESGTIESIILGIGINFNTAREQFPPELQKTATSLFNNDNLQLAKKNQLIAEVINEVLAMSRCLESRTFIEEYKSRSLVLGKAITVISPSGEYQAVALDIDPNGGLIVKNESGEFITINSGEVSIRDAK